MVINVKITTTKGVGVNIRRYGSKITAKERESLFVFTNTYIASAKTNLKQCKNTGELEESIGNPMKGGVLLVSTKGFSVSVGTTKKQGIFLNYGTKRHIIRGKGKKILKFRGKDGTFIYRKEVKHPGIRSEKCKFWSDKAFNDAIRAVSIGLKQEVRL